MHTTVCAKAEERGQKWGAKCGMEGSSVLRAGERAGIARPLRVRQG